MPGRWWAASVLGSCLVTTSTAVAAVPVDNIHDVQAEITALEADNAAAVSRVSVAADAVARAQDKLALFTRQATSAQATWDKHTRTLTALARQMYVNGGVTASTLSFALDDPDEFLDNLDRLSMSGQRQSEAVSEAKATAARLQQARASAEAERNALEQALAAQQESLTHATQLLQQAQQRLAELEAQAAAEEAQQAMIRDAQQSLTVWSQIASSPGSSQPTTMDSFDYGDSASWAASPKSQAVIRCESGGNYSINTGNGYYGAWQFDYPSWHGNGGGRFAEYPHQASKAEQDFVAWTYWRRSGWRPWECA